MSPRTASFLQLLWLALLAWMGCRLLAQWHGGLVVLLVLAAFTNLLAAWIVRYRPRLFAALFAKPVIRPYLMFVCWCLGRPIPDPDHPAGAPADQLLLRSARDFQHAAQRARQIVRGHDAVLDRLLGRIQETLTLRSRRRSGAPPSPLASFLLVGADGIGKRYLARVLSKLLYRNPGTLVFECDRLTADALVGTAGRAGELLEAIRKQPGQLVVFERVEAAAPDVLRILATILTRGQYQAPDTPEPVSFAQAVIVMTTAGGLSSLEQLAAQALPEQAWHARSVELLAAETPLSTECLNAVSDIVLCRQPDDRVKAEVVVLLMHREAAAHGVSLSRIDPEIIAAQVLQITDEDGFALVPERIKKLLRQPLLAAHRHDQKLMSLRVRSPEPVPQPVPPSPPVPAGVLS